MELLTREFSEAVECRPDVLFTIDFPASMAGSVGRRP
jgi:hypothetical protein